MTIRPLLILLALTTCLAPATASAQVPPDERPTECDSVVFEYVGEEMAVSFTIDRECRFWAPLGPIDMQGSVRRCVHEDCTDPVVRERTCPESVRMCRITVRMPSDAVEATEYVADFSAFGTAIKESKNRVTLIGRGLMVFAHSVCAHAVVAGTCTTEVGRIVRSTSPVPPPATPVR